MSEHESLPEKISEGTRFAQLSQIRVIVAAIVAVASLTTTILILLVSPTESGLAAAGAVATAGFALAGRLSGPPH
ncbi:hypothetical protein ABTY96_42420 [Streptomyces sp. NPDC096057]|uniref:hypothetical protein n=1 Tax=Streptomyces sp. NPDC096057 TaxID=3155543 RepID=UPI0033295851